MNQKGKKPMNLPALTDPRHWWKVELVPNAGNGKPIKVSLMESLVAGRKGLSRPLAWLRTIAVPEKIAEAADLLIVQVAGYEDVVGEFGAPGTPILEAVA